MDFWKGGYGVDRCLLWLFPLGCNELFHPALHLKILYMLHIKLISHKIIFNDPEHWQSTVY